MNAADEHTASKLISTAVARVLEEGALATLVTLIDAPRGVGAKVLIEKSGEIVGSTNDR